MLPYLEAVLNAKLGINDLIFVYPEFPLQRLTGPASYNGDKVDKLSEYADYLLWSPKSNTVYLVEFKTEVKSIKESQFQNYFENCRSSWKNLIKYYFEKAIGSKSWRKFAHGLIHLRDSEASMLLGNNLDLNLEHFLERANGVGINKKLGEFKDQITFKEEPSMKFIYLAPEVAKNELNNFRNIYSTCEDYYMELVTLKEFAAYTDEPLKSFLTTIDEEAKKQKLIMQ